MWTALEDGLACNLAGGTHHAFPDRGLGYCVLNDVAIAIRDLHAIHPDRRIFVVDTDAHQGNGSNGIFAGDARVSPIRFMSGATIRRRRRLVPLMSNCRGLSAARNIWSGSTRLCLRHSSCSRPTSHFGSQVPTRMKTTGSVR
jgi:hypothetical protein